MLEAVGRDKHGADLRPGRLLLREEYRHLQGRHEAQEPHLRPEVQHGRRDRLHLLVLSRPRARGDADGPEAGPSATVRAGTILDSIEWW